MSEICGLIFKKDDLYAKIWVPPVYKEKSKEDKETESKLVVIDNDFFDKIKEERKKDIIEDGYYKTEPLELKNDFNIVLHLRRNCKIEEGVTLRDIMTYVRNNEYLTMFLSMYSWAESIDDFHKQLDKECKKSENIKELVISWTAEEIIEYEDPKKKDLEITIPSLILSHCFSGEGPAGEEAKNWGGKEDDIINWSVSGNVSDVFDVPVRLHSDAEYAKIVFPTVGGIQKTSILKGEADFTLLDILDAIYWDITFYGSPCESEAFFDDIKKRKEIVEKIKEKSKKD